MTIHTKRNWIFIALGIAFVGSLALIKMQYDAYLNKQDAKNRADSLRLINLIKEHSILSQKAWKADGEPRVYEEAEAPQEIDDKEELAQAKLWQKLSSKQRSLMKQESVNQTANASLLQNE